MQIILVSIGEATTTTLTITPLIEATTIRLIATATIPSVHSNTSLDYIFYGIYTMKVLVLKRFIPSKYGKKVSVK